MPSNCLYTSTSGSMFASCNCLDRKRKEYEANLITDKAKHLTVHHKEDVDWYRKEMVAVEKKGKKLIFSDMQATLCHWIKLKTTSMTHVYCQLAADAV